jgi:nucleoside-diphosphate-sugar epimerase
VVVGASGSGCAASAAKDAVDSAVAGADAVVSALGPSMDRKAIGLPLVDGTRHVLEAMARHGVRRYVGHGTPSVADPHEQATFHRRFLAFMGRTLLPRAYQELLGLTALFAAADVDWTIVRFIRPTHGEPTGIVKAGFFTADQVADTRYFGRAPAISN